jgi:hypothetical protein
MFNKDQRFFLFILFIRKEIGQKQNVPYYCSKESLFFRLTFKIKKKEGFYLFLV